MSNKDPEISKTRERRPSRYMRAQERRARQRASDNKFYAGIFSLAGVVVMFSLLIAAISLNGAGVDMSGTESWTQPWLFGLNRVEVGGLILIAILAVIIYLRLRKNSRS